LCAACIFAAGKSSKKAAVDSAALIAVSVFHEPGFALPGAKIQLSAGPAERTGSKVRKVKGSSDPRGEFVFHVPPGPAQYQVSVSAKGYKPQQKEVQVAGEERVDVTFVLKQESK
jgi:hypothetical protein